MNDNLRGIYICERTDANFKDGDITRLTCCAVSVEHVSSMINSMMSMNLIPVKAEIRITEIGTVTEEMQDSVMEMIGEENKEATVTFTTEHYRSGSNLKVATKSDEDKIIKLNRHQRRAQGKKH